VKYITDFILFLDRDTIDHNDESYDSFKEVLAVLSFHRMGKSSQKTLEGNKKHKLTTLGKCILHNKKVGFAVHDSLEAYVFIYLKGKMQLSPDFQALLEDPGVDPDEEKRLLESVQEISDVVNFVGKAKKGEALQKERHGANDKLVWSWTDPIYDTYKKLMGELQEYNLQSGDKFVFDELDEKTLADYAAMNRRPEDQHEPKISSQDRGESVSPFVDLRKQNINQRKVGGRQPPKPWYPNLY
jgi:hypothetical protein